MVGNQQEIPVDLGNKFKVWTRCQKFARMGSDEFAESISVCFCLLECLANIIRFQDRLSHPNENLCPRRQQSITARNFGDHTYPPIQPFSASCRLANHDQKHGPPLNYRTKELVGQSVTGWWQADSRTGRAGSVFSLRRPSGQGAGGACSPPDPDTRTRDLPVHAHIGMCASLQPADHAVGTRRTLRSARRSRSPPTAGTDVRSAAIRAHAYHGSATHRDCRPSS